MKSEKFKKVALIYNPVAGVGLHMPKFIQKMLLVHQDDEKHVKDRQALGKKIQGYLSESGIDADLMVTDAPYHAADLAEKCVEKGYDLVVIAGGDGTINEVINGLMPSNVAVGLVPLGTVNILALQLNIPLGLKDACQLIGKGHVTQIDVGKANDRYFGCMGGIGFDAHVIEKTCLKFKKKWGPLAYVFTAVAHFWRYPYAMVGVKLDDEKKVHVGSFVLIANAKYYSGTKVLAKDADVFDGKLDVCLVRSKNTLPMFFYLLGFRSRESIKDTYLTTYQCKKAVVLKRGSHPAHVDAEFLGHSPFTFEIVPQALRIAVPVPEVKTPASEERRQEAA